MTTETQAKLTPEEVIADYRAYKRRKANSSRSPSASNRCSELGHPCTAYCYYARTVPAERRPEIDEGLAEIFDEGKKQERAIQADLLEMGYDVTKQQQALSWPEYNITGHRDFAISKNGSQLARCEFKSVNPYTYEKLDTPEDVRNSTTTFVQKWYAQTVLYMLLDNQKEYWLFLKNKSRGSIKPIVFTWNDEMWRDAEALIKKAELLNGLVQIGKGIGEDLKLSAPDVCARCDFFTVCMPELNFGVAAQVLTDELASELGAKTARHEEIKPIAKEYEELDEELKTEIKGLCADGQDSVVYGDWVANLKRIPVKAQPARTVPAKPESVQQRISFVKVNTAP